MGLSFVSQEDCHRRLHSSLCMYKGVMQYVTVDKTFPANSINIKPFREAIRTMDGGPNTRARGAIADVQPAITQIQSSDPAFTTDHPSLGFVNTKNGVVYAQREPIRTTIGGLSDHNVTFETIDAIDNAAINRTNLLFSHGFADMLEDIYPTFDEALSFVETTSNKRAFCKDMAITRMSKNISGLYYRYNVLAGLIDNKSRRVSMIPGQGLTRLLSTELQKKGIKINMLSL